MKSLELGPDFGLHSSSVMLFKKNYKPGLPGVVAHVLGGSGKHISELEVSLI